MTGVHPPLVTLKIAIQQTRKSRLQKSEVEMRHQMSLTFSNCKKIVFGIGFLMLCACSPATFQVSSQNLSSSQKDTSANAVNATTSETDAAENSLKKCSLTSNNPIKIGENAKFVFSTNFEIPKDSKLIWNGQSYNVSFTEADGYTWLNRGLAYSSPVQAGIHKRQVVLNDVNGNLICQSNVLKVEFSGEIQADNSCSNVGGRLSGEDHKLCSIEAWTLYRSMLARNLVNIPSQSGSSIGLANPSSVNCVNIGGNNVTSIDGSSSNCVVNKYKIWNLGF